MISNELVSVVIPSYNRFEYLKNAIDSVLSQTYSNFEIIVINDGSTQDAYYSEKLPNEVKVINLETNQKNVLGYVSNEYVRNFGIKAAQGKYLAFLDDDDIWMPNKLEIQINAMKEKKFKFRSIVTPGNLTDNAANTTFLSTSKHSLCFPFSPSIIN